MSQMMKAIDAGPLHMEFLYPRLSPRDGERERGAKRKQADAARKHLNDVLSTRRLACLMAVNFSPGDHVALLTFDEAHHPPDQAGVLRLFRNFCDGVQRSRGKRGAVLRVLARAEHRHGDGRWHIHALINDAGDLEELRRRWKYGLLLATPFRMGREKNPLSLAGYMTKERTDRVGQKRWMKRGLIRPPEVQSWVVPDEAALSLPPGAQRLEGGSAFDEFGKREFLFYMDENAARRPARKAPKREKREKRPAGRGK